MTTQAFRRLSSASKAARAIGGLIIQVGDLYIVGDFDPMTEVKILTPSDAEAMSGGWQYAGYIALGHLNRLGNGNHAAAGAKSSIPHADAFPFRTGLRGPTSTEIRAILDKRLECERLAGVPA